MLGFAILLLFSLLGMLLKDWLNIPLPANLIGLLLFIFALYTKIVKVQWVEASARWMTKHMMLFFVPFVVGSIVFYPLLKQYGLIIIISLIACTAVVLLVTGWVTAFLSKEKKIAKEGELDA